MEGLPKLPGIDFSGKIRTNHHVPHIHFIHNGYRFKRNMSTGIGNEPLEETSVSYHKREDAMLHSPILTYGRTQNKECLPFRPHFVKFDKMTLTFFAFFKQPIPESQTESFRTRYVKILYFLEDDSITVFEPPIMNSGLLQGRIVRRGKVFKNFNEHYSWKDFNIGMDIEINHYVFHITDCDQFTKDFLTSQGVDLNDAEVTRMEPLPSDRQIEKNIPPATFKGNDKLKRLLEFSGKVLKFDVILDESTLENDNTLTYTLYYFLEDDTISIRELHENREGRDHFPMFLKRTKVPRNWKKLPLNSQTIYLETTENEVDEYYQPKHLMIGDTAYIFGRRFLILNCDKFTRRYYKDVLHIEQPNKLNINKPETKARQRPVPDYLGLGTPEDSLASCFGLRPKPPKKDVIKYLANANKLLRYLCVLDSPHPEDSIRRFILSYNLSDDTISIVEPPIKNSGIMGGKFLKPSKIRIPGCDPKIPIYYSPKDIYIDALLKINDHRFRVIEVDLFVYRYMQEHPELFTDEIIYSIQKHLLLSGDLNQDIKAAIQQDMKEMKHQIDVPEQQQNVISQIKEGNRCTTGYENTYNEPNYNLKNTQDLPETAEIENKDAKFYEMQQLS